MSNTALTIAFYLQLAITVTTFSVFYIMQIVRSRGQQSLFDLNKE